MYFPLREMLVALLTLAGIWVYADNIPLTPAQLEARHKSKATLDNQQQVILRTDSAEWSAGVRFNPADKTAKWDLSNGKFLAIDVKNLSETRQLRLTMHISSGSKETKDLKEINTGIGLNPGETGTMRIFLPHLSIYQAPEGGHGLKTLDTKKINAIEFQMMWPFEPEMKDLIYCQLSNFRLEGSPDANAKVSPDAYFPFIDQYGQYIHGDWPEKIKSDEQLRQNHENELAQLKATPAPAAWDEYGGWQDGPQLEATGSFRTEKYQDKWFLVDPAGRLFWSIGIDVVRNNTDSTSVKDPKWFDKPVKKGDVLPFTDWNLQKKYGKKDYLADYYDITNQRLRAWGVNTVGAWGAPELMLTGKTPYTLVLIEFNKKFATFAKSNLKFYDVFDPGFEEKMGNILRDRAAVDPATAKSINDPMCIGYFIDNELKFNDITKEVIKAQPTQPAKIEFFKDLQAKYQSVDKLNEAWKTQFKSWDDALANDKAADTEAYKTDMTAFFAKFVDRYYDICKQGIKKTAPHRLYLGCRMVGFRQSKPIWEAAAKHCDVISVNAYSYSIANCDTNNFYGKPVILGEFHFGVIDRGMFSASLCPAGATQNDRAAAYTHLAQGALVNPSLVGIHYFQYRDQPLTGRWDGEGYQIGFVDVADTPYPELIQAVRNVGENMYQYRLDGKLKTNMK